MRSFAGCRSYRLQVLETKEDFKMCGKRRLGCRCEVNYFRTWAHYRQWTCQVDSVGAGAVENGTEIALQVHNKL